MKYLGEPFLTIIDYERSKKVFQFDDKGEFITEDKSLIEWMKKYKSFIKTEKETFKCKKCGNVFENKGLLLSHYREHKKGV
jgi:hypothetical protein